MISKTCQYAVRALVYIANQRTDEYISIKEIAEDNDLSYFFLGKIMNTLSQKAIVATFRGPRGGVKLARPAEDISLFDIVQAIDGPDFQNFCFIGLPQCDEEHSCPVHEWWSGIREEYVKMLSGRTLKNISEPKVE